jgi:hypothetical protein
VTVIDGYGGGHTRMELVEPIKRPPVLVLSQNIECREDKRSKPPPVLVAGSLALASLSANHALRWWQRRGWAG